MSQYRIVKRNLYGDSVFMPQKKLFGIVFVDYCEMGYHTLEDAIKAVKKWTSSEHADGETVWP